MAANLHRIADSYVARFADTFEISANTLPGRVTMGAVEKDMARGIRAHPKSLYEIVDNTPVVKATVSDVDVSAKRIYESIIQSVGTASGVAMDLDSPFVQDAAKRLTADLVTNVNKETKSALRQMIFEAIRDGDPPIEAQKYIRQVIGLTKRDAITVKRMMALHPERAGRLKAKLLRRRAINIARTETMRASNLGQKATWLSMADDGFIDRETFRQVWIVTDDDRLCSICAPMDGQTVSLEEDFESTERGVLPSARLPFNGEIVESPPLHPSCRCTTVAEFTDDDMQEIIDAGDHIPSDELGDKMMPEHCWFVFKESGWLQKAEAESCPTPDKKYTALNPPSVGQRVVFQDGVVLDNKGMVKMKADGNPVRANGTAKVMQVQGDDVMLNAGTPKNPRWVGSKVQLLQAPAKRAPKAPTTKEIPVPKPFERKVITDGEAREHLGQDKSQFTLANRKAVKRYTGDDFYDLNRDLRAGKKSWAGAIDEAFAQAKPTTEPIMLFRGTDLSRVGRLKVQEGRVMTEKGFSSTSARRSVGDSFASGSGDLLEIEVPPGAKMIDVNRVSGSQYGREQEILLPRDSRFVITSVRDKPGGRGGRIIRVRLLLDG